VKTGNLHDSDWQHISSQSVILGVKSTRTEQRTNSSMKTRWNIENETLAQHRAYCILKARFGGKPKFEVTLIFTSFPHGTGCHGTFGRLSNGVMQIRTKESFASKPVPSLAFCCRSNSQGVWNDFPLQLRNPERPKEFNKPRRSKVDPMLEA